MVEGVKVVREALAAGADVDSVYVDRSGPAADGALDELLQEAYTAGCRVFDLAPGVLARVADTVTPQPVMAVVRQMDVPLDELRNAADPGLVVVCVDLRDPGNAGTVLRSAEAAGATGVVCCDGSVDLFNPKTVRASAGALFRLPVVVGGRSRRRAVGVGLLGPVPIGDVAERRRGLHRRRPQSTDRPGHRQRGPRPPWRSRLPARRPVDHSHGRAGGVTERRHGGGRTVFRGGPPATTAPPAPTAPTARGPVPGPLRGSRRGSLRGSLRCRGASMSATRELFDSLPDAVLQLDRDHCIVAANATASRLTGHPLGSCWARTAGPCSAPAAVTATASGRTDGTPPPDCGRSAACPSRTSPFAPPPART